MDIINEIVDSAISEIVTKPSIEYSPAFYKEWFKSGTNAGFIGMTPWLESEESQSINKIIIDIGKLDPNNNVTSNTKFYLKTVELAVYMRSVVAQTAEQFYPKRSGVYSPESFISYGGTASAEPVARVFKIEWWGSNKDSAGDNKAFAFKCGHFKGKVSNTGAIEPDFNSPISNNMIRRTRLEVNKMSYLLDLILYSHVAHNKNWYKA